MLLQIVADTASRVNTADSIRVATTHLVENIKEDPNGTLMGIGQDAAEFGLKLLGAIVIYIVGAWLIRKIKKIIKRAFERRGTERAIATFTSSFVEILLWILLIIITISALGINTTSFAALLAAGGVAIGMALSGTVQNFAGGIMLLIFKPFKAGDFIEAQGYLGTVTEVNIVSTKLLTPDNKVITIPNGALSNGNINNYSQKAVRRVDFTFPLALGTNSDACMQCLLDIVKSNPDVLDSSTPEASDPYVAMGSFGRDGVNFVIRVWVKSEQYWDVYWALNKSLYDGIGKAGFKFAADRIHLTNN